VSLKPYDALLKLVSLLIYDLFNNNSSSGDYRASKSGLTNNDVERIWKEMVMSQFKVLPCNFPEMSVVSTIQEYTMVSHKLP
jgi:hypothetical protein